MGASILVIEDNPRISAKLVEVLEGAGYHPEMAATGQVALRRVAALQPTVVLVEALVPGSPSPAGIAPLWRAAAPGAKVILMTADPLLHASARAAQAPPDAFLLKPFSREQLLGALSEALGEALPLQVEQRLYDLQPLQLAKLFVDLAVRGETGVARLVCDGARRAVHLINGVPVFIESTVSSESLGVLLVKRGVLDAAQWAAVQDRMVETSQRPDEAAVELGFVDQPTMSGQLRALSRARLRAALLQDGGSCVFEPSPPFADTSRLSSLNPLALACDAVEVVVGADALLAWAAENAKRVLELSDRGRPLARHLDHLLYRPSLRGALEFGVVLGQLGEQLHITEHHAAVVAWTLTETRLVQWSTRAGLDAQHTAAELSEALPPCPTGLIEFGVSPTSEAEARPDPLAARVFEVWLRARGADHHAVLGVPGDAGAEAVENAWLALSRQFHPDVYASHPDPIVRRRAREVFLRASAAYAGLSDRTGDT